MDYDSVVNWFVHTVSVSAILSWFAGFTPALVVIPPFIYYCLMIYRDPTVAKWRANRRRRKIEQLKARAKALEVLDSVDHPK